MKRMLLFALALLPLLLSAQLFQPGEELTYRVSYRAKMVPNTEVATVEMKTAQAEWQGKPCYRVTGHGYTSSFFKWFFDLDDRYTIYIDTLSLRPLRFESDLHEDDYTFWSHLDYDWQQMEVKARWQSRQRPIEEKSMPLTPQSMDAISLFFNMRSVDADSFKEGEVRQLEMVLEDTVRYLNYRFHGREVKRIRRLGHFKTLKFSCQLGSSQGYSFTDGDEFTIWISDDRNKIPLWLESPIKVGSIQAYITKVNGLRYPLESRIKK